jgi:hypothetical protein
MMLGEWASAEATPSDPAGASKSQWILDAAQALAGTYTRITAVIWFNWSGSPFALDSSSASLAAANTAFGGC